MNPPARPLVIVRTGEPVPGVLAARGQFADLITGTLGDAWRGPVEELDARTGEPPHLGRVAAFVITGSSANVPNREPWMLQTEAWLRDVVGSGTPTFGICFGHQILAQALGGSVEKNPQGREIGTVDVEVVADDPLFEGLLPAGARTFAANVSHVDTVTRLPAGAVALARSSRDAHQVIRFAPTCYGVQFHPEFDAAVVRGYLEARREVLEVEGLDFGAIHAAVTDAPVAAGALRNFVRRVIPRRA